MPTTDEQQMLRTEAQPAEWTRLNAEQRRACERILTALQEAVKRLPQSNGVSQRSVQRFDAAAVVDPERASRILFLSGERGTGKTTVLTSLMNFSNRTTKDDIPNINILRENVVWLEPLDMELLPPSLNVLPAILARIERAASRAELAAGYNEPIGVPRENRGMLNVSPNYQSAMLDLQRLQSRIALGWQSNLEARAPYVDLDTFSAEVVRVESARISLSQDLQQVLNHLAATVFGTAYSNLLFVLPIDDIDLSPSACLSLLQLLRSISIPRLFAIVLGDLSIIEMIMDLQLSRQFAQAAGYPSGALLPVKKEDITAVSRNLAANMMRKLLPPGQRIHLRLTDLDQSLNFRPLGADTNQPRLHALLAEREVKFSSELSVYANRIKNLRDFLFTWIQNDKLSTLNCGESSTGDEIQTGDISSRSLYCGVDMLTTSLRRLNDLWLAWSQYREKQSGKDSTQWRRTAQILQDYVRAIIAEEESLDAATRHDLLANMDDDCWIDKGMRQNPILNVSMQTDTAGTVDISIRLNPHETLPSPVSPTARAQMQFLQFQRWQFHSWIPRPTIPGTSSGRLDLSRSLIGATILLHDFIALGTDSAAYRNPLLPPCPLELAVTEWHSNDRIIQLPWPPLIFPSFWESELFLNIWNDTLNVCFKSAPSRSGDEDSTQSKLVPLVGTWIYIASVFLSGHVISGLKRVVDDPEPIKSSMVDPLIKMAGQYGRRNQQVRDWLIGLALLTMPETGIPAWIFGSLPKNIVQFWNRARTCNEIRERRYQRLSQINAQDPTLAEQLRLAALLDGFSTDHIPSPQQTDYFSFSPPQAETQPGA